MPRNFSNVVLEKDEEDHLGRWCEKLRRFQQGRGGMQHGTSNGETMKG